MKLLPPLEPQDSMIAAMAYPFWPLMGPYILLSDKKNEPFVRFHAMQGIAVGAIVTAFALFALIISAFLFRSAPSVSDIMRDTPGQSTSVSESASESLIARNDSYMTQGCISIAIFSAIGLFVVSVFGFLLFCASRVWNGAFYSLPIIGKYIEEKYFSEFAE